MKKADEKRTENAKAAAEYAAKIQKVCSELRLFSMGIFIEKANLEYVFNCFWRCFLPVGREAVLAADWSTA